MAVGLGNARLSDSIGLAIVCLESCMDFFPRFPQRLFRSELRTAALTCPDNRLLINSKKQNGRPYETAK